MQRAQSDVRPSRYINYRLVPTINDTTEFMTSHEIERQISEIKMGLALNDEGASEPGSGDTRCNVCLTMKATRMATPYGHNVVCRLCAVSMTDGKRIIYATSIRAQHSARTTGERQHLATLSGCTQLTQRP
ncbi:hypothetical protein J6590_024939 [Homalodisca vitripennis]|nr:hypothetical protein J6590_024939 [Homalodisca vitripennis]